MGGANGGAETGKVTYLAEPGKLELLEYPFPELPEGALLLRTRAAGVCGSELHIFGGHHPLKTMVMGHEIVGEVTEHRRRDHDSAGRPLAAGDRVSVVYYRTCDECRACVRGEPHLCQHAYDNWMQHPDKPPHFTGTHGTHYYVDPKQWLFKVPDNLPDLLVASANCGLTQVWAGIERSRIRAGETLVIMGSGGLGIYATGIAKERGATVVAIDPVAGRLATARAFGADHTIDMSEVSDPAERRALVRELTNGEGADVGLGVAGVPAALSEGLELLRDGGRYIEIGNVLPGTEVSLDIGSLVRREVSIQPVIRYRPGMLMEALEFLSRNVDRLPFEELLDAQYPLEGLEDALRDSASRKINRAVLVMEAGE